MKTPKEVQELINSIQNNKVNNGLENPNIDSNDIENRCKDIIRDRLNHCCNELLVNINTNKKIQKVCNNLYIDYCDGKRGHFSFPTYKALYEALDQSIDDWNKLIWQQIVRQMYISKKVDEECFMYATEALLVLE